jgi:hypothetical protein
MARTGWEDMSRAEVLAFAKVRALEFLPHDPAQALSSLFSDLGKHAATQEIGAAVRARMAAAGFDAAVGLYRDPHAVQRLIEAVPDV